MTLLHYADLGFIVVTGTFRLDKKGNSIGTIGFVNIAGGYPFE
jgi:hypothetical protein